MLRKIIVIYPMAPAINPFHSDDYPNHIDEGAQWLSGRVFNSIPRGRGFEPQRHCGVSLSKMHLSLLSTGSTHEDQSRHN